MDDMGMLYTTVGIENVTQDGRIQSLPEVLVDTGSEFTWLPSSVLLELGIKAQRTQRFRLADGGVVERELGFAILHVAGTNGVGFVVFALPSDATLIGAHALEGLNLRVDL